jgi:hypothetical protein
MKVSSDVENIYICVSIVNVRENHSIFGLRIDMQCESIFQIYLVNIPMHLLCVSYIF